MNGLDIVSVIIVLGVLIFVHELGHFLVAKYCGVGVLKFSLGFGPRLIGKKYGETEYMLSLIPLGGYVKLLGESEGEELSPADEERSFMLQPVLKRMAIVFAGPLFNFIFAVVAFTIIYMAGVPTLSNRIGGVEKDSPAFQAGIEEGNVIVAINGQAVTSWGELAEIITTGKGDKLIITVEDNGRIREVALSPEPAKGRNIFGEEITIYRIGISASSEMIVIRENPFRSLIDGFYQTWVITKLTLLSIVKIIQGVVSPKTIGGPILIAQMAGAQVKQGIISFIFFMSVLSINLGVLNLFPIPVLDGGHLFFYLIELVTGRAVSLKWREAAQQIGFLILILLMLFVFYNDIIRIIGE